MRNSLLNSLKLRESHAECTRLGSPGVRHLKCMIAKPRVTKEKRTHECTTDVRKATGPHGSRPQRARVRKRQNPKRLTRQMTHARVQRAFRHDRGKCAKMVLEETWNEEEAVPSLDEQTKYWQPVLSAQSEKDECPVLACETNWDMISPIKTGERFNGERSWSWWCSAPTTILVSVYNTCHDIKCQAMYPLIFLMV